MIAEEIEQSRRDIITNMCYTFRHDFGLPKDHTFQSGLTEQERVALWYEMAQIFDNVITPRMTFKET